MKKLFLIAFVIFFYQTAQAQMSKGTTYLYQETGKEYWTKINTGTWMGESWISMSIWANPDEWIKLEIVGQVDGYTIVKMPNSDYKMKIEFSVPEKGIWVSEMSGRERNFFRLYEQYGERVD
jgi:hypothetical protein